MQNAVNQRKHFEQGHILTYLHTNRNEDNSLFSELLARFIFFLL